MKLVKDLRTGYRAGKHIWKNSKGEPVINRIQATIVGIPLIITMEHMRPVARPPRKNKGLEKEKGID